MRRILTLSCLLVFPLFQAEAAEGGTQRGSASGPRRFGPPPVVAALDLDGNGEISKQEIEKASQSLKKLDRNGDGKLSVAELFGRRPSGPPGRRRPGFPRMPQVRGSELLGPPTAKDDFEKKVLEVLEDMRQNQSRGMMNVPPADGRLLRLLAEAIDAKRVVEIGTSNGYSGLWICLALKRTGGKLITHEINEYRASLARENFKRAGVSDIVTIVMGDAHKTVTKLKGPVDMAFIDADKPGYADYLRKILPLVRPGGIIAAHNITSRASNPEYMKEVLGNPNLETIIYLQGRGLAVTLKKR